MPRLAGAVSTGGRDTRGAVRVTVRGGGSGAGGGVAFAVLSGSASRSDSPCPDCAAGSEDSNAMRVSKYQSARPWITSESTSPSQKPGRANGARRAFGSSVQ